MQRLDHLNRATDLLREVGASDLSGLTALEKEGSAKRFELAFELAWKTMRDYLEYSGIVIDFIAPKPIIKAAFASRLIDDGELWTDMLLQRNVLTHVYSEAVLDEALPKIISRFYPAIESLRTRLNAEARSLG